MTSAASLVTSGSGPRGHRVVPAVIVVAALAAGVGMVTAPKQLLLVLAVVGAGYLGLLRPYLLVVAVPFLVALPSTGFWADELGHYRTRLAVLLVVTVAAIVLIRTRRSARQPAVVSAAGVALVLLAVQVYTQPPSVGLTTRALECALAVMVGWLAYRQAIGDVRVVEVVGRALVAFTLVQVCLAVAQFVTRSPLLMASTLSPQALVEATNIAGLFRGMGTFSHGNSLGLWIAFVLPWALRLTNDSSDRWRAATAPVTAVLLLGAVLTLSRGAVVVCAVVMLAHLGLRRGRIKRVAIGLTVIALAGLVVNATPALSDAVGRFTSSGTDLRDAGSGLARTANMQAAWSAFTARPVTGHGFGTSSEVGRDFGGYTGLGAHNTYLDILQGGGLVLLLCFVVIGVAVWRPLVTARRSGDPLWLLPVSVLVYGMVESVTQGAFVSLIAIGLAMTLALYGQQQRGSGEGRPRFTLTRRERSPAHGADHVQRVVPARARGDRPCAYR